MPTHGLGAAQRPRSFDGGHVALTEDAGVPQIPRLHFEPAGPPPQKTPGSAPSAYSGSNGLRLSPTAKSASGSPLFGSARSPDRSPRASAVVPTFELEAPFSTDLETAKASKARAATPSVVGWSLEAGDADGNSLALYGTTIDDKWTPNTQQGRCCGLEFNLRTAWRGLLVCTVLGVAFVLGAVVADMAMGGTEILGTSAPGREPTTMPLPAAAAPPPAPPDSPAPPPPVPQQVSPSPPPPQADPLAEGAGRGIVTLAAQLEALTPQFALNFKHSMGTALQVEPARVEIVNIVGGSIIITFDVLPSEDASEPTTTDCLVALQQAVDGGTIGAIAGYSIASMQILELPAVEPPLASDLSPSPPPSTLPEYPGDTTGEPEPEPEPDTFAVHVCPQLFLGPDIGFQDVLEYHIDENSCRVSMQALGQICSQFYDECLSFIASPDRAPPPPPTCPDVFLGPEIGFQSVMAYHDNDHTCQLSINELAAVCSRHFAQCLSFLETETANDQFHNPEPEPEPLEPECFDNNVASVLASGYDCTEVVARRECVLVYQFCECACTADDNQPNGDARANGCAVVDGFVAPVVGQLAGHDMELDAYDSPDQLAETASECAFVCRMMDGTPGSVVSRRYCFSFDWNEEQKLCLIGTGAVSRREPGEVDRNANIDSTATDYCYYERLWDMDISALHHFSVDHNPMIGRLVQVEGEVTATIAPPAAPVTDDSDLLGGLPEGFFLQQTDLRATWCVPLVSCSPTVCLCKSNTCTNGHDDDPCLGMCIRLSSTVPKTMPCQQCLSALSISSPSLGV